MLQTQLLLQPLALPLHDTMQCLPANDLVFLGGSSLSTPARSRRRLQTAAMPSGEMFSLPDFKISCRLLFAVARDPRHLWAAAAVLAATTSPGLGIGIVTDHVVDQQKGKKKKKKKKKKGKQRRRRRRKKSSSFVVNNILSSNLLMSQFYIFVKAFSYGGGIQGNGLMFV